MTARICERLESLGSVDRLNLTSNIKTEPSLEPLANTNGFVDWAIDLTLSVCPFNNASLAPVLTSKIETFWSPPPQAISFEFNH